MTAVNRKPTLLMMELLVMLLVFSLAAAACLGIFAEARRMTRETERLDKAVMLAQNAAELLKAGQDPSVLETGELTLSIEKKPSESVSLTRARISVLYENTPVFTLETGWQEGSP